jgi:hypothetical protein
MTEGQILVRRFNDSTHLHDQINAAEAQMT